MCYEVLHGAAPIMKFAVAPGGGEENQRAMEDVRLSLSIKT